jgi:hypothetical protein
MAIHIGSVEGLISTLVSLNYGAVQTDSSKEAFAAGIRKNLGIQFEVRVGGGASANRPSRYRSVGSQLELVAEKALQGVIIHKEQNEVR